MTGPQGIRKAIPVPTGGPNQLSLFSKKEILRIEPSDHTEQSLMGTKITAWLLGVGLGYGVGAPLRRGAWSWEGWLGGANLLRADIRMHRPPAGAV